MSVLAQCGYGRSSKIEKGLDNGVIHGAILSPRDETRDRLEEAIKQWAQDYPNAKLLFDPQFYAATLNAPRDGHLNEYDYYRNNSNLGRTSFSPSRVRRFVEECLNYQSNTFNGKLRFLISPTILFDDFRDYWSQVSLNMAVESAEYYSKSLNGAPPLLVSIVVSEQAFQSLEAMEEFLDSLTKLDVAGFYLIIRRNANSLQSAMEAASLGRFMFFCYVLAKINEYTIVVGYSDWHSFLLESVGVNFTACGWYQNLRQFSLARFLPSTGGRRPRKRYSSVPLLSSPLIHPELQDIYLAHFLSDVLSGSKHDNILANGPAVGEGNWSDETACLTHWHSLNNLSGQIAMHNTTADRILKALRLIQNARGLYLHLESVGVSFDPTTGPTHLDEWQDGVQEFRGISRV